MKDEKRTNLTQDPTRAKMAATTPTDPDEPKVKIKVLRDVQVNGTVHKAGTKIEVGKTEAERVCRPYPGVHDFFGSLDGEERKPVPIHRAVMLEA